MSLVITIYSVFKYLVLPAIRWTAEFVFIEVFTLYMFNVCFIYRAGQYSFRRSHEDKRKAWFESVSASTLCSFHGSQTNLFILTSGNLELHRLACWGGSGGGGVPENLG